MAGSFQSVTDGTVVYVLQVETGLFYKYDTSIPSSQLVTLPSMPTPRVDMSMVYLSGKVVVAGGTISTVVSRTVEIFDTNFQNWTTYTNRLVTGRRFITGIAAGDRIVFAGGRISLVSYATDVDIYFT